MRERRLIFEKSRKGRTAVEPPHVDVPEVDPEELIPENLLRDDLEGFPELSELDVVRHYTELSTLNFGVDTGFYPLGSCTMKYNPRIDEDVAALEGFCMLHPYQPEEHCQGSLRLMHELSGYLCEIGGMDALTLQPSAGAQGELCGLLVLSAYFKDRGERRDKIIIPDTAHGTNPASSALAGFDVVDVTSSKKGIIEPEDVERLMDERTAGIMLTNPNTLGLFEENIKEIARIVHAKGGFVYCDGANLNALMGIARLGDMGVDLVQFNLHKTFATPHGGGGPGSGPLGVKKVLAPYLPVPWVEKTEDGYRLVTDAPKSIGRCRAFYGNFLVMVKAYAYIRRMGRAGLKEASRMAILNANYIKERLKDTYHLPHPQTCMHECVFSDRYLQQHGVTTMDVAKRLIDYGFHPPTVYFPLVVKGAIMIEPTETESPETLDEFIEAMKSIAREAKETPELLKNAPHTAPVKRVDEVRASRMPVVRWKPVSEGDG
ncbi:MAG TPA: glycine dehydrogenase subunit 2 [Deltaproteobacteria bacterium]|nr:glycine dehydrogenase subunit 2 [Deltaproteobacteria bacterium]